MYLPEMAWYTKQIFKTSSQAQRNETGDHIPIGVTSWRLDVKNKAEESELWCLLLLIVRALELNELRQPY